MDMVTIEIDKLSYRRAVALADDMRVPVEEALRRAVDVMVMARGVAKGHEIDRRNAAEGRAD